MPNPANGLDVARVAVVDLSCIARAWQPQHDAAELQWLDEKPGAMRLREPRSLLVRRGAHVQT